MVIGSKTRYVDEKCERPDLVVFSDQVDYKVLGAFVNRGEDKARPDTARTNVDSLTSLMEMPVHRLVSGRRVGKVIHIGDLKWCKVVRVKPERQKPHRIFILVFDLQPDRLDALPVQIDTKKRSTLLSAGHSCCDTDIVFMLRPGSFLKWNFLHGTWVECRASENCQNAHEP
ncbi:hypothetical protein ES703_78233 [subsurface metagenome]